MFLVIKIKKLPIYVSKNVGREENHFDLLSVGKEEKRHYVLINGSSIFIYDHSLHRRKKHFCRYCLQAFGKEEISKCHIKNCFKFTGKQRIRMPKKGAYVKFKNYETIIKSPFVIYPNF